MKALFALATLATLATLALAATAQAQVITIDQAKAMAGNVTPGDTPGFPVTLSQPGSYRLAGNLRVPEGVHGVVIGARNVTLDLNGFTLSGPRCGPARCNIGPGTGSNGTGVYVEQPLARLLNGSIDAFNGSGVRAEASAQSLAIDQMTLSRNGVDGATLVANSTVRDSRFAGNQRFGLYAAVPSESAHLSVSTSSFESPVGETYVVFSAAGRVLLDRNTFSGGVFLAGSSAYARSLGTNLCNGQLC
jgi:hypothetical protein